MPDENQKITARIRTFASDLDAHRQNRDSSGDVTKTKKETVIASSEVSKKQETSVTKTHAKKTESKPHPIEHFEVKAKETPETPKHIPAFHELQKQVSKMQAEPANRVEGENYSSAVRTNIGFDATVITDTKKNRQNLLLEIKKSLSSWFKAVTKPKKSKVPKYSVPEANHRKGVIQKATTKTGSIFTADSDTLKEQIRKRQRQDAVEQEELETTWSPYTDTGYNLLPGPHPIQNIKVEFKKQSSPSSESRHTEKTEQIIPHKFTDNNGAEELIKARKNLDDKLAYSTLDAEVNIPEQKTQPTVASKMMETQELPEQAMVESQVAETTEEPAPKIIRRNRGTQSLIERFDTNTITVTILVTIIALVMVIFISKLFIDSLNNNIISNTQIGFQIEPLIEGSLIETITVTTDNVSNLTAVLNNSYTLQRDNFLTELTFVTTAGDEIAPSYIFDLLNLRTTAAMKQSLTSTRFLVQDSEKAMLLKFVDGATVRGSFLNWEESMPQDFVRIFNIPTNTVSRFIDDKLIGYDIRVLKNNESTVLIYCIVNENTALITNDRSTLEKILNSKFTK